MRISKRFREAFKENVNVVGLATLGAASLAILNPLPLLVGLVAETAYLLFVPDSKWYDAHLSRRFDRLIEERRAKLKQDVLPTVRPDLADRFQHMEDARAQIGLQQVEGEKWLQQVLRKIDYLLEKYLVFASQEKKFREYLTALLMEVRGGCPPPGKPVHHSGRNSGGRRSEPLGAFQGPAQPSSGAHQSDRWVTDTATEIRQYFDAEIANVRQSCAEEQDQDTKAILEKRLDVLERRKEFVSKIAKILTNLNHQLQLVDETIALINDEIRARSPEQILSDIEDVANQTEIMTKVLEEVAPYEQMVARMQDGGA